MPAFRRPPRSDGLRVRAAIKTLLLLLSACSPVGPTNAPAPQEDPQKLISESAANCKNDVSEKAAQVAREKFPYSSTIGYPAISLNRMNFLRENRWLLFDIDDNHRMNFEEYHAWIWASLLIGATPGSCILTKEQYVEIVVGRPTDSMALWRTPSMRAMPEGTWQIYDTHGRGFITKDDLKDSDSVSFYRADIFRRGYLTPDQIF
jgi:hypothetical protein